MMVRFLRSGKWELIIMFVASSVAALLLGFAVWFGLSFEAGQTETRLGAASVFLLVSAAFGYWAGQRLQRRLDTLQLAMKQANNGNYEVRITETGDLNFMELYREFNELAVQMQERMKRLQMVGEEQVMIATSNEAAVLEERKRLARDLHDTVSQQLFAMHMCASSLPKLQEIDRERAASVLDQLIHMSTLAQKQMRVFIAQLRPLELEGQTLREALDKWFPDYCRQNSLQGALEWRIQEPLTEAKEHQLFLIVQEAMANVVKHAAAQSCSLTLAETERQITLNLQDDGAGFRVQEVRRGSYGLSTMQERAQKLGGTAEIISKPGSGTRVKVTIPKIWRGSEQDEYNERE
ncbi:sensor histidine kinase [Paenibacillus radicis (ex Gao et al. 2016)]|uniref:Oxygen sensor histidine kinase NreB n=1 Tax=Paenibacillus radicis (ex Gao et al. 2016) TaxID=1737354 RepID=A0A917M4S8_9BACL|nr:sensor histidine kinase [Paenibacillus radicis (ex Gao et al. 2016)]GGG75400.1 sensor histidine kinase LiaS [Paenibacillus radicis (ex Gao et al. 2016)]